MTSGTLLNPNKPEVLLTGSWLDKTIKGQLIKSISKCTLVTIATLLGTGILGLPSTLAYSGLAPFILTLNSKYI